MTVGDGTRERISGNPDNWAATGVPVITGAPRCTPHSSRTARDNDRTSTMRPTARLFNSLSHATDGARARTTGFIGLGRMGYEMAYNLFSRTLVESGGSARFVVCDAREESAKQFVDNFHNHFPGAKIDVLSSPAE